MTWQYQHPFQNCLVKYNQAQKYPAYSESITAHHTLLTITISARSVPRVFKSHVCNTYKVLPLMQGLNKQSASQYAHPIRTSRLRASVAVFCRKQKQRLEALKSRKRPGAHKLFSVQKACMTSHACRPHTASALIRKGRGMTCANRIHQMVTNLGRGPNKIPPPRAWRQDSCGADAPRNGYNNVRREQQEPQPE